jgi:uncharacterized membrane protein
METSESVLVEAPPSIVFPHVARLEAYPPWLRLLHRVEVVAETPLPAWNVELRAKVGPFARSKRLRMQRSSVVDNRVVRFERAEVDGREHSTWALQVDLEPVDGNTMVTMNLAYGGSLWSAGLLDRVLEDEIRRARTALVMLVQPTP